MHSVHALGFTVSSKICDSGSGQNQMCLTVIHIARWKWHAGYVGVPVGWLDTPRD